MRQRSAWYERAQTIDGGDVGSALARIGRDREAAGRSGVGRRLYTAGDRGVSVERRRAGSARRTGRGRGDSGERLRARRRRISRVPQRRGARIAGARRGGRRQRRRGDVLPRRARRARGRSRVGDRVVPARRTSSIRHRRWPTTRCGGAGGCSSARAGSMRRARSYATLVADFPASTWRSDADFRRGLVQYKAANYAGAALVWSRDRVVGERRRRVPRALLAGPRAASVRAIRSRTPC